MEERGIYEVDFLSRLIHATANAMANISTALHDGCSFNLDEIKVNIHGTIKTAVESKKGTAPYSKSNYGNEGNMTVVKEKVSQFINYLKMEKDFAFESLDFFGDVELAEDKLISFPLYFILKGKDYVLYKMDKSDISEINLLYRNADYNNVISHLSTLDSAIARYLENESNEDISELMDDTDGDFNENVTGVMNEDIDGDLNGNIKEVMNGDIGGNLNGNVEGVMNGDIDGDLNGNVEGVMNGDIDGDLNGDILGVMNGDIDGDLNGDILGAMNGDIDGDLNGNIVEIMSGDIDGDLNGDIIGTMTGDIDGDLKGDIIGEMSGDINGKLCGIVKGTMSGVIHNN